MNTTSMHLKPLAPIEFREICNRHLYIDCRHLLDKMFPDELDDSITGMFVYCYIDREAGISMRPTALASLTASSITAYDFPHPENSYIFRLQNDDKQLDERQVGDIHMILYALNGIRYNYLDLEACNYPLDIYRPFEELIQSAFSTSPDIEELRMSQYANLDNYRNDMFPDDIICYLQDHTFVEGVWIRLVFHQKQSDEYFGELLNEPNANYGVHKGDIIGVKELEINHHKGMYFTGSKAHRLEN